nr:MAG TPA: hypothetical protein [Caudoviricetes sp.]
MLLKFYQAAAVAPRWLQKGPAVCCRGRRGL